MLTFLRKIRRSLIESLPAREDAAEQAGLPARETTGEQVGLPARETTGEQVGLPAREGAARQASVSPRKHASPATRYLLYAIGEIALVVIGILIALQINNWNEENRRQKEIRNYLINLSSDLEDDLTGFRRSRNINIFRFHSLQYILRTAKVSLLQLHENETMLPYDEKIEIWPYPIPAKYNKGFIDLGFKWSSRVSRTVQNTSTIDELKSAGLFSHIRNKPLKDAINKYYAEYAWRIGDLTNNSLHFEWEKALIEKGFFSHDIYDMEEPLLIFREHPPLTASAKALIRDSRWRAISSDTLATLVIEIIHLVNQELEKNW